MSNWIDCDLDVLAGSPAEITQIEAALQEPCDEVVCWFAGLVGKRPEEVSADVKGLVSFKADRNLGYIHPRVNEARRVKNSFKDRHWGTVMSHILLVSEQFPSAIFLMEYWDRCTGYAGQIVVHAGEEVREFCDDNPQAEGQEWVLPHIFAPYWTEWSLGLEFGSLWDKWVSDLASGVGKLRSSP